MHQGQKTSELHLSPAHQGRFLVSHFCEWNPKGEPRSHANPSPHLGTPHPAPPSTNLPRGDYSLEQSQHSNSAFPVGSPLSYVRAWFILCKNLVREGTPPKRQGNGREGYQDYTPLFSQVWVISPEPRTFLENISSKVTQLTQRLETWWPAMWKQMLETALLFLQGVLNPFQSLLSAWAMRHFCSSTTLVVGVWLSLCACTLVSGLLASTALAPSNGPFDWPAGDFILSSSPLLMHSTVLVLWTRKSSTMFLFDSNGVR